MSFAIIGNGFVGQATKILKTPNTKMLVYDIDPKKCEPQNTTIQDLEQCDIIFVSVPTPMGKDGRNHLGIVQSVVQELKEKINTKKSHIVIRSTVLPGTSNNLDCYFMPEFLTEKNWANDFKNCENWIFGLKNDDNEDFINKITNIINQAYEHGCIAHNKISFVKNSEAEMIKYFRNTYLALKVSFCNEIFDYCVEKNIDYNTVANLATADKRIGQSHSQVPGHDGRRGFGGTCFPKDTNALLREFEDNNVPSFILRAAVERNEKLDRPERDWSTDVGRAVI